MAKAKTAVSKVKQDGMYRCLKDNFGYCDGKPNFTNSGTGIALKDGKGGYSGGSILQGATCSSDPKTCRKHRTLSQMVAKAKEVTDGRTST